MNIYLCGTDNWQNKQIFTNTNIFLRANAFANINLYEESPCKYLLMYNYANIHLSKYLFTQYLPMQIFTYVNIKIFINI